MKTAYKITMPILTLGIIPVLFFMPFLHLNITSSLAGSLMSNLGMSEYQSIYNIVKFGGNMDETQSALWRTIGNAIMDKDGKIGSVLTNTKYLYVFAVFACLMLLFAIAAAVLSIATKKYGITTCFTLASLISAFAMNKSFDAFAKPLLTGEISISSFLSGSGSGSGNILSNLLGSLAKVESLELSFAYSFTFLILIIAVIFSVIALIYQKNSK
ncbi:MAG: hypothetical protein J1E34_02470 [Oscillospiraceae bacterium]|nr:hypothetical protein [Oscillospiraceae bacterium]